MQLGDHLERTHTEAAVGRVVDATRLRIQALVVAASATR